MRLPPKTWVEVSGSALRHNVVALKKVLAPGAQCMAVVKSNAYGHGLTETVTALRSSVAWFGVDSLIEAQEVRRAAPGALTLVLGVTPAAWLKEVPRGTRISVSSPEQARQVAKSRAHLTVHLEIETGLTRQGIEQSDISTIVRLLSKRKNINIEGVFTHFANIDDGGAKHPYAKQQLRRFQQARDTLQVMLGDTQLIAHAACSAPGILFPQTHFDLARTGIALYGYWPSPQTQSWARASQPAFALHPALIWKTIIAQVKNVARGTPIGYGLSKCMPHRGRVAVLPIGYWDGYDRGLASIGSVLVRGQRAPIIGRICMNMCMVDVSFVRGVTAGDEVVLLGGSGKQTISAEELATKLNTNTYEVLTRINPLIPRILV